MRVRPGIYSEWPTVPGSHRDFDRLYSKLRLRDLRTALAYMAIGAAAMVVVATTVAAVTQDEEQPELARSVERTPSAAIELTFATLRAASVDLASANRPQELAFCSDFDSSFLDLACSKYRSLHAPRIRHRVATLVIGHPAASLSSATAQPPSGTVNGHGKARIQIAENLATSTRNVLDGAPPPSGLEAALKVKVGKCNPAQGCYTVAQGDYRWLSSVLSHYEF